MHPHELLGNIDVYVLDQIMRGRLRAGMDVLDAGCGGGRNVHYPMRMGCNAFGADRNPQAVEGIRSYARELAPHLPPENFVVAPVESMPFPDGRFDAVLCVAVLHFARDEAHFRAMLGECARVLRPGGVFFARLMTTVGMEKLARPAGDGRHSLPGFPEPVFLADEALLLEATEEILGGRLADPLKSTVVHGQRTMTTWVVYKEEESRHG